MARALAITLGLGVLIVSFQNFTNVPLDLLRPQLSVAHARAVSPTDGTADMRELAPTKPKDEDDSIIAVPQSGHDLDSVGQDWMTRQTNAITGGAEQKILDKMNRKMNRWVNGDETVKKTSDARTPASEAVHSDSDGLSVRPKNVHFSRVNKMDMDLIGDTHLSCQYKGSSVQWDLTRNVIGDVDVNIRHETRDDANSIHLQYNW